jgi:hypothetical protein
MSDKRDTLSSAAITSSGSGHQVHGVRPLSWSILIVRILQLLIAIIVLGLVAFAASKFGGVVSYSPLII